MKIVGCDLRRFPATGDTAIAVVHSGSQSGVAEHTGHCAGLFPGHYGEASEKHAEPERAVNHRSQIFIFREGREKPMQRGVRKLWVLTRRVPWHETRFKALLEPGQ